MREKYKIFKRNIPDDIDFANSMLSKGYELINVVPRFFSDGTCAGYTYWFVDVSEIK